MDRSYPLRVRGELDPGLGRGLWLIKWLLLIPHAVVLFFLWIAFFVLTVVAFFAILFTGKYPRALFDFNVGVLRWSWRVWFYGYYALGTDRYPPFLLHDDPTYPAGLEVDHPPSLSRGLVLVKSWLLAIPHYLVVSVLTAGGLYLSVGPADDRPWTWGGGLVVLLTVIAGVILLFSGRYPRPLFDLVVGIDRWVLRVVAYAALMTDQYPPFRLDQGPHEPAQEPAQEPTQEPAEQGSTTAVAPAGRAAGWTPGRVVGVTLGSIVTVLAILVGAGATALLVVDQGLRDRDGYLMSGTEVAESTGYAVITEDLDLHVHSGTGDLPQRLIGTVKITVDGADGREVFVGIARTTDVAGYLDGVAHSVITNLDGGMRHRHFGYREVDGGAPENTPSEVLIWDEQVVGSGPQELRWAPRDGEWTVVVMNADGSPGVSAEMRAGATVPLLGRGVAGLYLVAGFLLLVGVTAIVWSVSRAHRSQVALA